MKLKINEKKLKIIFFIAVPMLILFWLFCSLIFINRINFSIATHQTLNLQSDSARIGKAIFEGKFISNDDSLGMIVLKLQPFKREKSKNEDIYIFRLKQIDNKNWEHVSEYRSGLFDSQEYFSFGVPRISNSKDLGYEFEFLPKNKNFTEEIQIDNQEKFLTGYFYSKSEILSLDKTAYKFLKSKLFGFLGDSFLLKKSIVFLIPLFVFLILFFILILLRKQTFEIKLAKSYWSKIIKIFILFLLFLVLLPKGVKYESAYLLFFIWITLVSIFRLKSNSSFIFSFFIGILWLLLIPFGLSQIQSNLNIILYFLIAFGALQFIYEEYKIKDK